MRFQFCGNISCPEWFIAEISVLTKITAVKMRLIFAQLVAHYLDNSDISAKTLKLLTGTGLDHYEMNAVVSTLYFILSNAVMFQVPDALLNKELLDLGLPKENVESISKVYKASRDKLIESSLERAISISHNLEISYSVHQLVGSSALGGKRGHRFAECELTFTGEAAQRCGMAVCEEQLDELIHQLTEAAAIMRRAEKQEQ